MKKLDRRVRRTQHALRTALIELTLEKGFEAVTILEITERADVGRSTFYAHFADKEDLLQDSIEMLHRHLEERIRARDTRLNGEVHPALAFCLPMLEHILDARELFDAIGEVETPPTFIGVQYGLGATRSRQLGQLAEPTRAASCVEDEARPADPAEGGGVRGAVRSLHDGS